MLTPDWLEILTGPNVLSGSTPVGRQPNLSFVNCTVTSDVLNQQNVVTPLPTPTLTGWRTAFDVDYTNNGSQTFSADGNYTIGGVVHALSNSLSCSASPTMASGTGIVIKPSQNTFYTSTSGTPTTLQCSAPIFRVNLAANIPSAAGFDRSTPLRLWINMNDGIGTPIGLGGAGPGAFFAIENTVAQQQQWTYNMSIGDFNLGGSDQWGNTLIDWSFDRALYGGRRLGSPTTNGLKTHFQVYMFQLTYGIAGDRVEIFAGNMTGSSWPGPNDLLQLGYLTPLGNSVQFFQMYDNTSVAGTMKTIDPTYPITAFNAAFGDFIANKYAMTGTFMRMKLDYKY